MAKSYPDPESKSAQLAARARRVMPGGNTRTTVYRRPYPIYARSGSGFVVQDEDGIERIDFVNNYTSLIHGHANKSILAAAGKAMSDGSCFGLPTESEIRLAEILVERIGAVEAVRFTNSGTEAVMMAIKAARAYTSRPKIAKCEGAYHGAYDFAEVSLDSSLGNWGEAETQASVAYSRGTPANVLRDVVVIPFNNLSVSRRLLEDNADALAAVIVDPVPNRIGLIPASHEYVHMLRDFCTRHGVVLIADEVISFRVGYSGGMAELGVAPDLMTLGKIIGGGFPVGAVAGRRDLMAVFDPSNGKPPLPHGGTFNANPVTMAAGAAAMEAWTRPAVQALNALGDQTRARLRATLDELNIAWQVTGQGSLFRFVATEAKLTDYRSSRPSHSGAVALSAFADALLNHNVFIDPTGLGCLSTPMSDKQIDELVTASELALTESGAQRSNKA